MNNESKWSNLKKGDKMTLEAPVSFRPKYIGIVIDFIFEDSYIVGDSEGREDYENLVFNRDGIEQGAISGYEMKERIE